MQDKDEYIKELEGKLREAEDQMESMQVCRRMHDTLNLAGVWWEMALVSHFSVEHDCIVRTLPSERQGAMQVVYQDIVSKIKEQATASAAATRITQVYNTAVHDEEIQSSDS